MGVPVVALTGRLFHERYSHIQLLRAGLGELSTENEGAMSRLLSRWPMIGTGCGGIARSSARLHPHEPGGACENLRMLIAGCGAGTARARRTGCRGRHALRDSIDVGGTFTDLVAVDDAGGVTFTKSPSTPEDQSVGVMAGLGLLAEALGVPLADMLGATDRIVHGGGDSASERKGARTALLPTEGHRDVLEMREGLKPIATICWHRARRRLCRAICASGCGNAHADGSVGARWIRIAGGDRSSACSRGGGGGNLLSPRLPEPGA